MDTKRFILFLALAFVVLITWQWMFPPPKPTPQPEPTVAEESARPDLEEAAPDSRAAIEEKETDPLAEPIEAAMAEQIVVETDVYRVELTNRGGVVTSWTLKHFAGSAGEPLEMVSVHARAAGQFPLSLDLDDGALAATANESLFIAERERFTGGQRVIFRWADRRGAEVTKVLEFRDDDYLVGLEVEVIDRGRRLPARVAWGPGLKTRTEKQGGRSYYYGNQVLVNVAGSVDREKGLDEVLEVEGRRVFWAGIEDQYFAALIVPLAAAADFRAWPIEITVPPEAGSDDEAETELVPMVSVSIPEEGALVFAGPKNYSMLSKMGHQLGKAVWFSSVALFAWMARILYTVLLWVHANIVGNYGLAIILTTLALRIVLFPINQFAMVRMKKFQNEMAKVQPKLNAIKKKYSKKKDAESRAKMNTEMMALYKEEGINPMGGMSSGCLPLLAQFPILIGFYDMLLASVELRGAPFFGWIQDLTVKDPFYVTPILMGITMFLQQKMSQAKIGDPAQQRIMMMMPLIFTIMFLNLPSGLVLYWFVNNVLGIGQQWLVNRHIGKIENAAQKA